MTGTIGGIMLEHSANQVGHPSADDKTGLSYASPSILVHRTC